MSGNSSLKAIIWDYDGTLVDTWEKNLSITRKIVKRVSGIDPMTLPSLQTLESYVWMNRTMQNWRDLYTKTLGLTEEETDAAGMLWSEYQLRDTTPTPLFPGILAALSALEEIPQGIVSQNSREAIARVLGENNLLHLFRSIIGYEEVHLRQQKPEPNGLLMCIEHLTGLQNGTVLYIGDHETDMACALNANRVLEQRGLDVRVVSIGATYSSGRHHPAWTTQPDHEAKAEKDIISIVQRMMHS